MKKHVEILVKVDVTAPKPYYLVFDYCGEEEFLNRILNVVEYQRRVLTIEEISFLFKFILKSSYIYRFEKIFDLLPFSDLNYKRSYSLETLLKGDEYITFRNKNEAEDACLKIGKLLNDFIEKEWIIYNDVLTYLDDD